MRLATWLPLGLLLVVPGVVRAHATGMTCTVVGDRVQVEGYFDDDTPARGAKVSVFDEAGAPIASGKTDADGRWSFARPAAGKYRVDLNAGAGHRATRTIDVPPADGSSLTPAAPITAEPSREEFTGFPWGRVFIGLAVIAGFALLAWLITSRHRPPTGP